MSRSNILPFDQQQLIDIGARVDDVIRDYLQPIECATLRDAMAYSAVAGGKRIRAFLTLQSAALFETVMGDPCRVAAAIEAVHSYSLVHDDLPAMDDDDLRRGKPSLHRATDEATAILTGDALLTAAFSILSDLRTAPDAQLRVALMAGLAQAAGAQGMVAGQVYDMAGAGDVAALETMHRLKTGALIAYAVRAGALLGGATADQLARLETYSQKLGLAFQIVDDILDATASTSHLGKTAGKDKIQNKLTFVSAYGIADAQSYAQEQVHAALEQLTEFGDAAEPLRQITQFVINRQS